MTNRNLFEKGNCYKQRTKSIHDYCGIRIIIHMPILLMCAQKCQAPGFVVKVIYTYNQNVNGITHILHFKNRFTALLLDDTFSALRCEKQSFNF